MIGSKRIILFGGSYNPKKALGSDLIAWWDADGRYWGAFGGMTDDGSGVISSWKDIKAGYDATAATTARPTFSASSFNGGPGVTFDGTANVMTSTTAGLLSALPAAANPSDIWVLCSQDALVADTTARYAASYGNGNLVSRAIGRSVVTGVNRPRIQTGDGVASGVVSGAVVDLSSRHVLNLTVSATAQVGTVDGVTDPASSAIVPSTTASRFRIGSFAASAASLFHQGTIVAVLVTLPLSGGKRAALQSWLMARRRV